jgi:SAM-dependent methyltransferase
VQRLERSGAPAPLSALGASMNEFVVANQLNWDDRAKLHSTDPTGFYSIDGAVAGTDDLSAIEAGEIGDVSGRRLVHLQCHIGLDTIRLAHRGAVATGLDFSAEAISAARDFARRAGRDVRFVHSDIYDAPAALGGAYEIAYVTWGAINWLPDIFRWARVVSDVLEPGGFLYLAESHPATLCLEEVEGRLVPHYAWRTPKDRPVLDESPITYTGDARRLEHARNYNWIHPLSDILNALSAAGLSLEWLHEHELLPYKLFPMMVPAESPGLFRLPEDIPPLALSFSLKAVKR